MSRFYTYKQNRVSQGFAAEQVAESYLIQNHGWKLVARRFWAPRSEIDLVMCKREWIYFIEVRSTYAGASEPILSIRPKKLQALRQASLIFLQKFERYQNYFARLDLVIVRQENVLDHIKNISLD